MTESKTGKCVNRSLCWGSDYPCDDCTPVIYDLGLVMAKFDKLVHRLQDTIGGFNKIRPSLLPPLPQLAGKHCGCATRQHGVGEPPCPGLPAVEQGEAVGVVCFSQFGGTFIHYHDTPGEVDEACRRSYVQADRFASPPAVPQEPAFDEIKSLHEACYALHSCILADMAWGKEEPCPDGMAKWNAGEFMRRVHALDSRMASSVPAVPQSVVEELAAAVSDMQEYCDETACTHICKEFNGGDEPESECGQCRINAALAAYDKARGRG